MYVLVLDIDECKEDTSDCEQECMNTEGGYKCSCVGGYTLNDDNATCTMGECAIPFTITSTSVRVWVTIHPCMLCCFGKEAYTVLDMC